MTSSVFFKFKSQREPTRVEFDGTGISVFELKREIITKSGLGDGTDFDLFIYTDDNSEEYDDDTTIIPRSTTVIARRQPALKQGAGRAARYVTGKMPVTAKNAGRKEQAAKASASKAASNNAISQMNNAMTEEEKMAAMFAAQTEQWSAQQEEMSHQTPVFKAGQKRPANVPDHDPPNGYICYRCGNKGHWIQLCPTNDDPEFDNRPRVKRTTGIPRSFLQKVDKSVVLAQTEGDESKRPSGIMVNAEGDFVIAEPDKASWEQFQAKAKTSSAVKAPLAEDKVVQELGLVCSIDKKMFIEPMKTPCCQKTFCNDCITNALIESDFVCPACQTEGVLIDDLQSDEETSKKIQEYLKEKEANKTPPPASPKASGEGTATEKLEEKPAESSEAKADDKSEGDAAEKAKDSPGKDSSKSPVSQAATVKSPPTGPKSLIATQNAEEKQTDATKLEEANSKKRPADGILDNPRIPKGPKAMQNQQPQNMMPNMMNGMPGMNMGMNNMMFNGMPMMPNMMGMPNMGNMNMGMGMPMMGMPGMMGMPDFQGMNGGFGGMNGWGMGMNGNGMNGNMGGMNSAINGGMNGGGMNPGMNGGMNGYQNGNFSQGGNGNEDDAYFRKPVNPHRHQNKQRRVRPSDYREL
ncbi:Protein mpe1 [Neonectria punicea]|uniref:Protein mpe1 n=1 Tax=Neonectria punicea TaxID=979145 RepID=A0ABR1HG53_9HYPO